MRHFVFWIYVSLLLFLCSQNGKASHAMGSDITYTCKGPNTYEVTLTFYRDCEGVSAPPDPIEIEANSINCNDSTDAFLSIQSVFSYCNTGSINSNGNCEISAVCNNQVATTTCNGGTLPGVEKYQYSGTLTLPQQCADWVISYSNCCRNDSITNLQTPSVKEMYTYATINNSGGLCNSSPNFTSVPVPYICAQKPFTYNHGAVDSAGDSLVYSLVDPLQDETTPINHLSPFSASYPLNTNSGTFSFDSITGQMNFVPIGRQNAVIAVLVEEYRNGQLIGTTMRNMQVLSITKPNICSNPANFAPIQDTLTTNGKVIDSNTIATCPKSPAEFSLIFTDPENDTLKVSSNVDQKIPNANFSIGNNNDTAVTANFSWTPDTSADYQNSFQVAVDDTDSACGLSNTFTYNVLVVPDPEIQGPDTIRYCGDSLQLNTVGGFDFSWTPSTGLSQDSIASPMAAPSTSRWYSVSSECGSDSVYLDTQYAFSLDAGPDTAICFNDQVQLNAKADSSEAPYDWAWSPSSGLSDDSIADPIISPNKSTKYQLTAVSDAGCTITDEVNVGVIDTIKNVTAVVNQDSVCRGNTVNLDLATPPKTCGLSNQPCNTPSTQYTVGTGANTTGTGTPYEGFWEDGRVIILYRVSDLNAMGLTGGKITEIAFNIANKQSTQPYSNFTIKMGCTNRDSLYNFVSGLDVVFGPKSVTTTAGWNNHILDTPYDWDGNSNLLVEVCFDNGDYTDEDEVFYTSTSYNSVVYDNTDGSVGCTLNSATTSTERPNIRFQACQQDFSGNATVSWSPASLVDSPNVSPTTATVDQDQTYAVEMTDTAGCAGSQFIDSDSVKVALNNPSLSVNAGNDTSLCSQQSVPLDINVNGKPPLFKNLNCGVNNNPCPDSITNINTFGSDTFGTGTPTPYRGGTKGRMQFLYRANELTSQGIQEGVISALGFDVKSKYSTAPYKFINIKMGCTSLDSVTENAGYANNLQLVYSDSSFTTSTGWNVHEFDSTFDWDGHSNILVEVCFSNPNGTSSGGGGNNDHISASSTAYNSAVFTYDQLALGTGCSIASSNFNTQLFTYRPNLQFHICTPPPGDFIVDWTPTTGLSDSTVLNPLVTPNSKTSYVVEVTGKDNCSVNDTVTIDPNPTDNISVAIDSPSCKGSSTGTAWVQQNGASTPYSVNWSNGSTTDTIKNLSPDSSYSLTVTFPSNCSKVDSFTLNPAIPVSIDSVAKQDITCHNKKNGEATAFASGGYAGISFKWNNDSTTQNITNLSSGSYNVTATSLYQCADTATITISEPPPLEVAIQGRSQICTDSNGTAYAIATGGTSPYSYSWNTGQQEDTLTNLAQGTYLLTVTDDQQCSVTSGYTVSDSLGITIDGDLTICPNQNNGTIFTDISGGTTPYSYSWNGNYQGDSLTNLNSGTYQLTATDKNGCEKDKQITVSTHPQPQQPSIAVNNDTLITTNSYTNYQWFYEDDKLPGAVNPIHIADTSGTYFVEITDTNGCTINSDTVQVQGTGIVEGTFTKRRVQLYPNPSEGLFTLDIGLKEKQSFSIRVKDVLGSHVVHPSQKPVKQQYTNQIDLTDEPAGLYFIIIKNKNKGWREMKKVIVK